MIRALGSGTNSLASVLESASSGPILPPVSRPTPAAPLWTNLLCLAPLIFFISLPLEAQDSSKSEPPEVIAKAMLPEDLLGDEHLREEYGVNGITTPSIEAIFELLDTLGTLHYDELKRSSTELVATDRITVSLGMGALIADGFLIVQCQKIEEMNGIGRSLLKHAKILGAGTRMNRHSQSLLEHSLKGDWATLRKELSKTQFDVEAEMLQLRDVDIAHLVSLGGWARAFQIATQAVDQNYNVEKTRNLARRDIVEYFLGSIDGLSDKARETDVVKRTMTGLQDLLPLVDVPEGQTLTVDQVKALRVKAAQLANGMWGQLK
jgi:hypothetical protein